jgi:hypothetical protein
MTGCTLWYVSGVLRQWGHAAVANSCEGLPGFESDLAEGRCHKRPPSQSHGKEKCSMRWQISMFEQFQNVCVSSLAITARCALPMTWGIKLELVPAARKYPRYAH